MSARTSAPSCSVWLTDPARPPVAACVEGKLVVDAWAGAGVDGQTLFTASSAGKGVAAVSTCWPSAQLDYEAPVSTTGPSSAPTARSSRDRTPGPVTLGWRSLPAAGLRHGHDGRLGAHVRRDRRSPLAFDPGSQTAYHNFTFGYIVGEIVRRIDGRPIQRYLQEICHLNIDSLYFGVPASELHRVATRTPDNEFNRDDVRQACIPSSGLIANARSLARHYALLAEGGEIEGVRLLSPARIAAAAELQTDALDQIYNVRVKRGLGRLGDDTGPGAGPRALGHVGAAMFGYADPERRARRLSQEFHRPEGRLGGARTIYASIGASD